MLSVSSGADWNYLKNKTGEVKTSQYFKSSKEWLSKLVKVQMQKEYLPKIIDLVVGVKANKMTLDIADVPNTSKIAPIPRPDNLELNNVKAVGRYIHLRGITCEIG